MRFEEIPDPASMPSMNCESLAACTNSFNEFITGRGVRKSAAFDFEVDFFRRNVDAVSVEYGCGEGRLTTRVNPTYAVDYSPRAIAVCQRLGLSTEFICGDFTTEDLPEPIDYFYSAGETLTNLSLSALAAMAGRAWRNGREGSVLKVTSLAPRYYGRLLEGGTSEWRAWRAATDAVSCLVPSARSGEIIQWLGLREGGGWRFTHVHEYVHAAKSIENALSSNGWTLRESPENRSCPAPIHFFSAVRSDNFCS